MLNGFPKEKYKHACTYKKKLGMYKLNEYEYFLSMVLSFSSLHQLNIQVHMIDYPIDFPN